MADGVGFEPTIRDHRIHTFQACALDRSATHPHDTPICSNRSPSGQPRAPTLRPPCRDRIPEVSSGALLARRGRTC